MDLTAIINNLKDCPCGKKHELQIKKVEISERATDKTGEILKSLNMGKNLHIVGDKKTLSSACGLDDTLKKSGFDITYTIFEDMRCSDMISCKQIVNDSKNTDSILAIGTGSINDLCRYAAFLSNKPYSVFATAPSMDGFASCVSPIIENGFKRTYTAVSPLAIIADTDILAQSPNELKAAGFGDIIGKYTALADWKISHILTGEYFCDGICNLVKSAVEKVCAIASDLKSNNKQASKVLMEALVLSGIAIQLCGSSRPASGAEHHLSHFWEMKFLSEGRAPEFHGTKVAISEVIIAGLYKKIILSDEIKYKEINKSILKQEGEFRNVFGQLFEDVIDENTPNPLLEIKKETLENYWEDICNIINEIPDVDHIKNLLKRAGSVIYPNEVGIEDKLVEEGIKYSCYIRKRITFLRIINNII